LRATFLSQPTENAHELGSMALGRRVLEELQKLGFVVRHPQGLGELEDFGALEL